MLAVRKFICLAAWCFFALPAVRAGVLDPKTEALIEQLPSTSEVGYGYSATFSGSQFLPDASSSEMQTLVLSSKTPRNSVIIRSIVERGVQAVPSLLKHLDDCRETRIPPLKGMEWISFGDEYDYNHRLRINNLAGVNKEPPAISGLGDPDSHIVTVGDLCYVALGQIVNRDFNAARYQPTGGLIISSPSYSSNLCSVARGDFENLTEKGHRELLSQDFIKPDCEQRRNGACRRIAFYYPDALEGLVLQQLMVSAYDNIKINSFVRDELYPNKSKDARQRLFDGFLRTNGNAFFDGVRLQLFDDLYLQEGDEHHSVSPPLNGKYNARALLIQLYGYGDNVKASDKPYATNWDTGEEARFIDGLVNVKNPKIDREVEGIFLKISDDDYLALSCIKVLTGRGYDGEILQYCERRIPESKYYAVELRQIMDSLSPPGGRPGNQETNHATSEPR
jgi:hypothetical protein